MNRETAGQLLDRAEKLKKDIIIKRQRAYLKPFFNVKKVWAAAAEEYIAVFAIAVDGLIKGYQQEALNITGSETLFNSRANVRKAKKTKSYKTHEYLDERYNRVVVGDIRDSLDTLNESFQASLKKSYDKYITKGSVRDSAELVYKNSGIEFNFNKFDKATGGYLADKAVKWSKEVAEETERAVKYELVRGHGDGLSSYEIAENIRNSASFGFGRSEAIARTEIISSCNYADYTASNDNPDIIGHEWSSTGDGRTRPTHDAANGQKRKKGVPFDVGGYKLLYPGDSSLGAPAGEVINCRCTLLDVFKGEGLDSDTVYDEKDAGTEEWLRKQTIEFQEEYLGGKTKQYLFQSGNFDLNDRDMPTDEVIKNLLKNSAENISKIPLINPADASPKEYYRKLLESVHEVQYRGIKGKKEFARVVDYATGMALSEGALKDIIPGSDTEKKVEFSEKQIKELNEKENAYIVIHNHPDSISFSFGDIVMLFRNRGIKSLIVVGHDGGVYYLSGKGRIKGLPVDEDGIEEFTENMEERISRETYRKYVATYGKKPSSVDNNYKTIYNSIVSKIATDMGFIYR